jgi:hypothetical protein
MALSAPYWSSGTFQTLVHRKAGPNSFSTGMRLDGQGNQDAGQGGQDDEGEHQGDLMEDQSCSLNTLTCAA